MKEVSAREFIVWKRKRLSNKDRGCNKQTKTLRAYCVESLTDKSCLECFIEETEELAVDRR